MENMRHKVIKAYQEIVWSARQLEDRMRGGAIQHCMVEITPTGTVAINAIVRKTMGQEIVFVSCGVYRIHTKHTYYLRYTKCYKDRELMYYWECAILYVILSAQ